MRITTLMSQNKRNMDMLKPTLMVAAVAAALLAPGAASAVSDAEMQELREQVRQLKEQYEKRIESLEQRLQQAEGAAQKAQGAAATAGEVATKAEAQAVKAESAAVQANIRPTSEAAFNPAVSVILNGAYASLSQDPARYQVTGFAPTMGDVSPGKRGFSPRGPES